MTRPAHTLNPRALTRLLAVVAAAAVVILAGPWFGRVTLRLLGQPTAFLVLQPAVSLLIIGGLLLTGYTYRDRIAELEAELERRDREHAAEVAEKEAECQRLHLLLTEAQLLSGQITEVPLVRVAPVIPLQRGPVPVADELVPIHDEVLIEQWIEDIRTWGEDAGKPKGDAS